MGLGGLEPPTSRLSGVRSNQLSYRPVIRSPVIFKEQKFILNSVRLGPLTFLLRKEVIHPHLPVGVPCYDFTPVTSPTVGAPLLPKQVRVATSGRTGFRGVTGGVYKARERIHGGMLIRRY